MLAMRMTVGRIVWTRRTGLEVGSFQTVAWLQRWPCPSLAIEIEAASIRKVVVHRWDSLGRRVQEVRGRCVEVPVESEHVEGPTCRIVVVVQEAVVDAVVAEGSAEMAVERRETVFWQREPR